MGANFPNGKQNQRFIRTKKRQTKNWFTIEGVHKLSSPISCFCNHRNKTQTTHLRTYRRQKKDKPDPRATARRRQIWSSKQRNVEGSRSEAGRRRKLWTAEARRRRGSPWWAAARAISLERERERREEMQKKKCF